MTTTHTPGALRAAEALWVFCTSHKIEKFDNRDFVDRIAAIIERETAADKQELLVALETINTILTVKQLHDLPINPRERAIYGLTLAQKQIKKIEGISRAAIARAKGEK